ncbi:class I SAM-dependent methyltransferase [uncultured Plantibacter sp.]|uniref:class I SAM-dependent methyltransferase n=1 Tax=uncultured Plantibacter sp. TaxID=293337 RepID=UPI0028D901D0|nr:class I SAM-dependent methyltransferase [uncultured Plantibacter sp.]
MTVRSAIGTVVERIAGEHRLNSLRSREDRFRRGLARRLHPTGGAEPEPVAPPALREGEPDSDFDAPDLTRHELISRLHELLQPRTYLEIGVNDGLSIALSRAVTIGVDPDFAVRSEVQCDLQLVRATSDDFFARQHPMGHLGGVPLDFAFIDGMHLAEFAYRDFMNLEQYMAPTGVIVLDDMLPRSSDEAARNRFTRFWAGDVFKFVEVLTELRPDLVVVRVNTAPTGVVLVTGLDPESRVLAEAYDSVLDRLTSADPQVVPDSVIHRRDAVGAQSLLSSTAWAQLVAARDQADVSTVASAVSSLRRLKTLGGASGA